jgi:hypothetical protein
MNLLKINTTITPVNNGQFWEVSFWTPQGAQKATFTNYEDASLFASKNYL